MPVRCWSSAFSAWWRATSTNGARRPRLSACVRAHLAAAARCRLPPITVESESHMHVAVLIGRFQPFHQGHAGLLAKALAVAPKVVVVLGSSFHARSAKNPFTWQE